jgi:stage V sporulation protein B
MKRQSKAKGFAVLSSAAMIVKIISLLYVPFLTIIIGTDGFGVYSSVYAIFTFFYILTNSGIPVAISKLVSELIAVGNYKDAVKTFKLAREGLLILGLICSLLLVLLAKPITRISKSEEAFLGVVALAPAIFITSVMSAYRGYFQGRGNMTPTAISQVAEQIINTIFTLIFAALLIGKGVELGVVGATVGTTLGALVACIYLIIVYKRDNEEELANNPEDKIKRLSNKVIIKRLIKYCVPITLSVGLQNAGNLVDQININARLQDAGFDKKIKDEKYGMLCHYGTLTRVPLAFISALSAVVFPSIAAAFARGDKKVVTEKIKYVYRVCALVAVPAAVGLAVLSKPIYEVLFPISVEGYKLLAIGAIVVIFMAFVQIQVVVLQSAGYLYSALIAIFIGVVAKIVSNYVLVGNHNINIYGGVYSNIIYYLIPFIMNTYSIRKNLRIRISFIKSIFKPTIASAFMAIGAYASYFVLNTIFVDMKTNYIVRCSLLIFPIVLGAAIYAYVIILIGGIIKKDIDSMPPKVIKMIPNFLKSRLK